MKKFSKLITSAIGTFGIGLVQFNLINADEYTALATVALSALATFGVYQVPNQQN